MTPREASEFDRRCSDHLEGVLPADEVAELERRVRDDADCRRRYLEMAALVGSLGWATGEPAEPVTITKPRSWRWVAMLATLAALVAVGVWVLLGSPTPTSPERPTDESFARVVEVGGRTELTAAGREATEATVGTAVFPGQTLHTGGADGFTVLDLGGGSRLELGPDARLRVAESDAGGRKLVLTAGLLRGVIGTTAITLLTPQAEVSLRDARFLVSAAPDVTEVETETGSVRLVRSADGRALDIPAGSAAVVASAEAMELRPAPRTLEPIATYKVSAHFGLAFTKDARTLVAGSKGTGWTTTDRTTGRTEAHRLTLDEPTAGVMLRPDAGEYLMVLRSGKVRRYDPLTGKEAAGFTITGHTAGEWAMSADGSRVVFGRGVSGATERLKVWQMPAGQPVADSPAEPPPRCVAISPNGRLVAWAADGTRKRPGHTLCLWDVAANTVNTIAVPDRLLRVLAFSPDGTRIAGGSDQGAVHVWEVESGNWQAGRDAADGWARPARVLAFAPDGQRLAAGLVDGSVRVWDATDRTPELVLTCDRTPVFAVAFSTDGRTLAAGSSRGTTRVWDLAAE